MQIIEIKKGNEVFQIHHNVNGYFVTFGASVDDQSNMYELNLNAKDVQDIKSAFTKSKLKKK